ncbi:FAD-dependent oxidoreductase [Chromobacterium subtsugae]|uniref:FAD-dependent oxidoreductase n=1 Tax=Chromobacterium subtsugae TaxID=251747 RepID=UPI000641088D|nr:NAD(P)/FAD-dependent oxidoreductase [Chromobacterium subtsugae]
MPLPSGVAIVGAGPAGLLLARGLHLHGIPFTLFDRDASAASRPQGGMLDLHPDTGQQALRSVGLFESFLRIARYEDQGMRVFDRDGRLLMAKGAEGGDCPEVDRGPLRDMLLDALPAGCVRWGHALREAEALPGGGFELCFGNGAAWRFDFVVGADGAWSRVRPLLSRAEPVYSGLVYHELSISDIDAAHPELSALVGRGTLVAKGGGKTLFAQRNANAQVRVYAVLRQALVADGRRAAPASKAELLAAFADWDGRLRRLIQAADEPARPWPIHALPVGHRWEGRDDVTLIGDAAHLMAPAGEGANLALRDACDLAAALGCDDWRAALRGHEARMFARAELAAARAQRMLAEGAAGDRRLREVS